MLGLKPMKKKSSLLLIEDDQMLGPLYSALLTEKYNVVWVTRCDQALTQLESQKFDLILLDVMLPDMSGIDFFNQFPAKNCHTVFLTNLNHGSFRQRIIDSGAQGVIIKSEHTPDTFMTTVQQFLTQSLHTTT